MDFHDKYTGAKFFVRYDVSDMSIVALYELSAGGDLRFVSLAEKVITVHRNIQEQDEYDVAYIRAQLAANDEKRLERQDEIERIMEAEGVHPSQAGLLVPVPKGIGKAKRKRYAAASDGEYGKYLKQATELTQDCLEDRY
jgi:hypothetical protein